MMMEVEESYLESNKYMFENKVACDIAFEALSLSGNKVSIPAHKYVLISRNKVFRAMLYGPMANNSNVIEITDMSSEALTELFRFIYYGAAKFDEDIILELLYSSSKYMIPSLACKCSEYLAQNIDSDNVCFILEYANLYEQQDLMHRCMKFITRNAAKILDSESYKNVQKETLQLILSQDSLCADEDTLLTALFHWAEIQCNVDSIYKRKLLVQDIFSGLADKIRVNSLSKNKRKDLLESNNILALQLVVELGLGRSLEFEGLNTEVSTPRLELPVGRVYCDVIATCTSSLISSGRSCAPLLIETSEPIIIHKIQLLDRFRGNTVRVNLSIKQSDVSLTEVEIPCHTHRKVTEYGPVITISLPENVKVEEGQFTIESRYTISHGSYGTVQVGEPKSRMQKFGGLELVFKNTATATPIASFEFSVI